MLQAVNNTGNATGDGNLGIRNAVAHGIAGTDTHGDLGILRHLHQLVDERNHKAVEIGSCDILQVTSGHNPCLKRLGNGGKIVIHAFLTGHLHFLEDVVVTAGNQDTRLADAQVAYQLEVLLAGTDPSGDLGEFQPQLLAFFKSFSVLLAIYEELGLTNNAVGTAELGHQLEDVHDLLDRIGLYRLLTVAECGIGDPDILGHSDGNAAMVERDTRNVGIGINVAVQVGLRHVLQRISVRFLFQ